MGGQLLVLLRPDKKGEGEGGGGDTVTEAKH